MNAKKQQAAIDAYRETLDESDIARLEFFQGIWDIQERHTQKINEANEYALPEVATLEQWYWDEKPAFLMAPRPVDEDTLFDALDELSDYLAENGGFSDDVIEALRNFDWLEFIRATDLDLAGKDPSVYLEQSRETFDNDSALPADTAILVLTLALRSMLEGAAQSVMGSLSLDEANTVHDKPVQCPVCGTHAVAAYVGETPSSLGNGRMLYCALCGTEWEYERIRCACCGTQNQGKLHYFHIEGDEAHRLHNCDECGDYMRTVFNESSEAPFCFEVEDVVMARLDQVAHDPRFSANGA